MKKIYNKKLMEKIENAPADNLSLLCRVDLGEFIG